MQSLNDLFQPIQGIALRLSESQFHVPAQSYLDLHPAPVGMSMLELLVQSPDQMAVAGCYAMVSDDPCSQVQVMEMPSCQLKHGSGLPLLQLV